MFHNVKTYTINIKMKEYSDQDGMVDMNVLSYMIVIIFTDQDTFQHDLEHFVDKYWGDK